MHPLGRGPFGVGPEVPLLLSVIHFNQPLPGRIGLKLLDLLTDRSGSPSDSSTRNSASPTVDSGGILAMLQVQIESLPTELAHRGNFHLLEPRVELVGVGELVRLRLHSVLWGSVEPLRPQRIASYGIDGGASS